MCHQTRAEYMFFPSSHGTYTNIYHILDHKTDINKFKRIEIIQSMLSDHSGIKLKNKQTNKTEAEKLKYIWRFRETFIHVFQITY